MQLESEKTPDVKILRHKLKWVVESNLVIGITCELPWTEMSRMIYGKLTNAREPIPTHLTKTVTNQSINQVGTEHVLRCPVLPLQILFRRSYFDYVKHRKFSSPERSLLGKVTTLPGKPYRELSWHSVSTRRFRVTRYFNNRFSYPKGALFILSVASICCTTRMQSHLFCHIRLPLIVWMFRCWNWKQWKTYRLADPYLVRVVLTLALLLPLWETCFSIVIRPET